jgi:hypothetical protein
MAGLSAPQRAAILQRYGGLVRTYFTGEELRKAYFAYRPRLDAMEVEFHEYLRLAAVLETGQELVGILTNISLAPSFAQERVHVDARGQLNGPLDVRSYLQRYGRQTTPRTFPIRRVRGTYATPENALAATAGLTLLGELQQLGANLSLGDSSEARLARTLVAEVEQLLGGPVLGWAAAARLPMLVGRQADPLLERVAERWRTRRISNLAYWELLNWADRYRRRGLEPGDDASLAGVAYAEGFDDRLFEIYTLACVRDAFSALGFQERAVRPLHESKRGAVLEVGHPHTGLTLGVHFQRAAQLLWTEVVPREWEEIGGIPDIVLAPSSSQNPVMIIDAKNRDRGADARGTTEELYKMLGYFHNFSRRLRVRDRGPLGALVFRSPGGTSELKEYRPRQGGGGLFTVALDPCDPHRPGWVGVKLLLEGLLRGAGLLADRVPLSEQVRAVKQRAWATSSLLTEEMAEQQVLQELHDVLTAAYADRDEDLHQARNILEQHLLGQAWSYLDENVRSVLTTGEVFWADHQLAVGLDFAPVVAELARSMEIVLEDHLFAPSRAWGRSRGLEPVKDRLELGTMRVLLEEAEKVGQGRPPGKTQGVVGLDRFLHEHGLTTYAYNDLIGDLLYVNGPRRRAAHKEVLTGIEAREFREQMLGVGSATSILARLLESLAPLR